MSSLNDQTNNLGSGLTSLTFAEFTWDNENGGYKMISSSNLGKLHHYMRTHYPCVTTIDEMPPYLIIWCKTAIPEPSKRPLIISGLLALWLIEGQILPPEIMDGFLGNLEIQLEIGSDNVEDLRPYHIPKTDTLWQLMRGAFPDALARNGEVERLGMRDRGGELLHSVMLKMDDIYVVDNDAMGSHTAMLCKGKTVISQPHQDKVVMGIFATSDPVAYGEPSIRAGCCG
ncbi:hypothetical protein V501_07702 [Pseudogymnoascus sp. VKM F-4519 (FW-2642)]|nr:hypothetical protein V501_07702 [Pseudogymnoascus sp. VKM F-4519 (FW-2642)]